MTEYPAKTGVLQWYWCLAISTAIHGMAAVFLCLMPSSIELIDYSDAARRYDQSHSVVWAEVYREPAVWEVDKAEEYAVTAELSPDADPFEHNALEIVVEPVIRLEKRQPELVVDVHSARRGESTERQESESVAGDEPVSESVKTEGGAGDTPATGQAVDDSEVRVGGAVEARGNSASEAGSAAGAVLREEIGEGAAADLNQVWLAYTKTLSQHFRSRLHYPEMARKLKLTGTVWVLVELRRDGSLISVQIDESSGVEMLDEAALDAVRKSMPVAPFPEQTTELSKKVRIPYRYKLKT